MPSLHFTVYRVTPDAFHAVHNGADALYLGASVIYRGDLKRQPDGTWRFERLVIGMDAYKRLTPASSAESK